MSGSNRRMGDRAAEQLQAAGWRIVLARHYKAYCPCGEHMLVFSATASDHRAEKNNQSQIRRALAECSGSSASREGEA